MRRVIASLFVTGALAGSAMAQPATEAQPAAQAPAAAAAPAAAPAASRYPVAQPQVAVQDPSWRLFPPPPEPEPEPIVIPPTPTDPNALAVLQVLTKVCVPAVGEGANVAGRAEALGLRERDGAWVYSLERPYSITIAPQGSNQNVCTMTVEHPIGGAEALRNAVAYWALTRQPQMKPYRKRDKTEVAGVVRYTSSWEDVRADGSSKGVVFVEMKKANGSPMSRRADRAQILYSERK